MTNPLEISLQKLNSQWFIDANPTDLVLLRAGMVANGAGGARRGPEAALTAQKVRLLAGAGGSGSGVAQTALTDGETTRSSLIVFGIPGLDIQDEDRFVHNGKTYEVSEVAIIGGYAVKATAVSL